MSDNILIITGGTGGMFCQRLIFKIFKKKNKKVYILSDIEEVII